LKTDDDEKMTGRKALKRTITPRGTVGIKALRVRPCGHLHQEVNEQRLGTLPSGRACVSAIATTPQSKKKILRYPHRFLDANAK
jgi:hypothetical protein